MPSHIDKGWPLVAGVLLLLGLVAGPAQAQAQTKIFVTGNGSCTSVIIGSRSDACAQRQDGRHGFAYMALQNGRVIMSFPVAGDRTIAFIGGNDSQPHAEHYYLFLQRIRVGNNRDTREAPAIDVGGICRMNASADGQFVHRIACEATDANGSAYQVSFEGDGLPVEHVPIPSSQQPQRSGLQNRVR